MSLQLDREGIFKARPVSWKVEVSKNTKSVAVAIEFVVLEQLQEGTDEQGQKSYSWESWSDYVEHRIWGRWYVVGKEGRANETACEQLASSMGWGGSLKSVKATQPPSCVVQVTVKADTYEGKTRFKADWMNPEDYQPGGGGADENEVAALDAQFGSLLRAATSSKLPKPVAMKAKPAPRPAAKTEPAPDDIPF